MHIESIRIRNFRRLQDVRIDLASDISIFVGANNSGKTSATHALQLFTAASRERFSIHDFSSECWDAIDRFGEGVAEAVLPAISMDIWFNVEPANLHRVVDLLPSLSFTGNTVGMRVEFAASNPTVLLSDFQAAHALAAANARAGEHGAPDYHPSPRTLCDYLRDENGIRLRRAFELRYYVLDRPRFDDDLRELPGYVPRQISGDRGRSGRDILAGLVRVDFLHAQRHLSDSSGGTRAEELSRVLGRFYQRNLEQRSADFEAQRALADSESMLNDHLDRVFGPTLNRLAELGYPGLGNPRLLIKTALNPATIMNSQDGTRVHYALGDANQHGILPTLPDRYNGLGFKNLIYMVVELLDLHARWLEVEESRPPLHLVFIEEPEAHLHVQLQQVFVRKVLDILSIEGADAPYYASQLVISTHSSHILYERGFRPIRYFRRSADPNSHTSEVLNLSAFYHDTSSPSRNFLERYLKLTHCDLFFADAAVLVEGNVERLLLPQMIASAAPRLRSAYLSVLEIGGAFGHRFKSLVDFLGITTLIITDIDSVLPGAVPNYDVDEKVIEIPGDAHAPEPLPPNEGDFPGVAAADEEEEPEGEEDEPGPGTACLVSVDGAVTSNQTLIKWLPGKVAIVELLAADESDCIQVRSANTALVRVAYQTAVDVEWNEETAMLAGRTLEEAFALENLVWSQDKYRKNLKLRIRGAAKLDLAAITQRLHKKIAGASFHKTDFALALLEQNPSHWSVPDYIAKGLRWLESEIIPPDPDGDNGNLGGEALVFEELL
ncbi:ATP-dependent endonuclease [Rhizobium sp. RAF36]|uniref:ATP-dependent nuclease n=1 Tax=Rhizobium sp. RAF36 TaxID=3233055 RepID=UPI003F98E449